MVNGYSTRKSAKLVEINIATSFFWIHKILDCISNKSILCTDSHKSYIQFANSLPLENKRIKRGKHKEGLYHIQHINALHSNLLSIIGGQSHL